MNGTRNTDDVEQTPLVRVMTFLQSFFRFLYVVYAFKPDALATSSSCADGCGRLCRKLIRTYLFNAIT